MSMVVRLARRRSAVRPPSTVSLSFWPDFRLAAGQALELVDEGASSRPTCREGKRASSTACVAKAVTTGREASGRPRCAVGPKCPIDSIGSWAASGLAYSTSTRLRPYKRRKQSGATAKNLPTSLLPVVALVGRPNVGKSALFNRLVKKRVSIVHNTPLGHVTRDYQEGRATLGDMEFLAVDTSGLEVVMRDGVRTSSSSSPASRSSLTSTSAVNKMSKNTESINMRATKLTEGILHRSDVILFLLDGRDGVTAVDRDLARWFRRRRCGDEPGNEAATAFVAPSTSLVSKIVPVVNKCEGLHGAGGSLVEVSSLGFNDGEYVGVSAETGEGMADLYGALQERVDGILRERVEGLESLGEEVADEERTHKIHKIHTIHPKVAIMGLTNVGKSTLLNRLVGHDRCITGPEPGLTRDAITVEVRDDDDRVVAELVDTAGWIRRARLKAHDDSDGAVAEMTMREGKTVLRFVHAVLLVVDCERVLASLEGGQGNDALTHAEAALAADAVGQGRALVIGLNKVDACARDASISKHVQESRAIEAIRETLRHVTPELGESAIVLPLSAIGGQGVKDVIPSIQKVYSTWNTRIPTARLNTWLRELKAEKAHVGGGNSVSRIKYLSQVKSRPPTFVAFVSGKTKLGDSVSRFVANRLRDDFDLTSVPVRVVQRTTTKRK